MALKNSSMRLFVLISVFLTAQLQTVQAKNPTRVDSSYIESWNSITTGLYYSFRNHRLNSSYQQLNFPMRMQPKEVVGISIFPGAFGFRLGIQLPDKLGKKEDERNFALNLNAFGKHTIVELFYRDLYGFNGNPFGKTHLEGSLTYFLNSKKYSHSAAYAFTQRQRKSAGSMSIQTRINHQNWYSDTLYLEEHLDSLYRSYTSLATGLGYAYSLVFLGNAYIDCGLNLGPEIQWMTASDFQQWTWMSDVRMALGFNHRLFYTGITGNFDFWNESIEDQWIRHQFSNVTFHIGFRIN